MNKNNSRTVWSSNDGDQRKKEIITPDLSNRKAKVPATATADCLSAPRIRRTRRQGCFSGEETCLSEDDMKSLAKKLKQECGTGGTVKDGMIEIQGEHRQKMADVLQKLGYKVKIAGWLELMSLSGRVVAYRRVSTTNSSKKLFATLRVTDVQYTSRPTIAQDRA